MRVLFLFLALSLASATFAADKKGQIEISGLVTETINGVEQPVPYATISLVESLETIVADCEGRFHAKVTKGKQKLLFTCFGYTPVEKEVKVKSRKNKEFKVELIHKSHGLVAEK